MNLSRRKLLATVGVSTLTGLAGCSGDNAPEAPDDAVNTLPHPTVGDEDAPIVVEVYSDYRCPHCNDWFANQFPKLKKNYLGEDVAFVYHDYIVKGDFSWNIASGGRAIQDEHGEEKFFEFLTEFHNASEHTREQAKLVADSIGASTQNVAAAMNNNTYAPVIKKDEKQAQKDEVFKTPTVLVNGKKVKSNYDKLTAAIDEREK